MVVLPKRDAKAEGKPADAASEREESAAEGNADALAIDTPKARGAAAPSAGGTAAEANETAASVKQATEIGSGGAGRPAGAGVEANETADAIRRATAVQGEAEGEG